MTPPEVVLHFSEDPGIRRFEPKVASTQQVVGAWVWAVDSYREPTYWFPRECPRITFWSPEGRAVTEEQRAVLGWTAADKVHAIESGWLDAMRACTLHVYRLPGATFRPTESVFDDKGRGFWVSAETVVPLSVEPVGDLLGKHAANNQELRITPSLWDLWDRVVEAGLAFSGIRLRNATPRT